MSLILSFDEVGRLEMLPSAAVKPSRLLLCAGMVSGVAVNAVGVSKHVQTLNVKEMEQEANSVGGREGVRTMEIGRGLSI